MVARCLYSLVDESFDAEEGMRTRRGMCISKHRVLT